MKKYEKQLNKGKAKVKFGEPPKNQIGGTSDGAFG